MNENQKRILVGLIAGSALSLTLGLNAHAEEADTPETAAVPPSQSEQLSGSNSADSAPAQPVEADTAPAVPAAGESAPADAADSASVQSYESDTVLPAEVPGEGAAALSEDADVSGEGGVPLSETTDEDADAMPLPEEVSTGAAAAVLLSEETADNGDADLAPSEDVDTPPVVTVGDQDLSSDGASGWNGSSGWRYDGSSISMVNNDAPVDIHAEGTGVDLSVSGLNHIGTLYADGDVNITGTGILLIDSIDMLEGTQLNLLTNTDIYSDGSAAVFLLQEDGTYLLINGDVVGILDESYVIPEGITLVVPDGGTLDMRITAFVTTATCDEDYNISYDSHYGLTPEDYGQIDTFRGPAFMDGLEPGQTGSQVHYSVPTLTVSEGSALCLEDGSSLLMQASIDQFSLTQEAINQSTLTVNGTLEMDGTVSGYSESGRPTNAVVNISDTGSVTGSGSFLQANIHYSGTPGNTDCITLGSGSNFILEGTGPAKLTILSECGIFYNEGTSLQQVNIQDGCTVTVYAIHSETALNIQELNGTLTVNSGCVYVGGNLAADELGSTDVTLQAYVDENGNYHIPFQTQDTGLVYSLNNIHFNPICAYVSLLSPAQWGGIRLSEDITQISWDTLSAALGDSSCNTYFVYTLEDGQLKRYVFSADCSPEVDIASVILIRGTNIECNTIAGGGGAITIPSTQYSGTGILGGEDAGSFRGGNAAVVLLGNRTNPEQPSQGDDPGGSSVGSSGGSSEGGASEGGNTEPGSGENGGTDTPTDDPTNDPTDEPQHTAPGAGTTTDVIVQVVPFGDGYRVSVFYDGIELRELGGGTVHAVLSYSPPAGWNTDDLFAVFSDESGNLIAVKLIYDASSGTISFDTPILGSFRIVCLHWEDSNYESAAFLAALKAQLSKAL